MAAIAVAGCGGDENEGTPALSAGEPLGIGGSLTWVVADRVTDIDPLTADTRAELLLSRQIHEPLIVNVAGPFGDARRAPGLALRARPSGDGTIWTLRLRRGVSFQDGSPFNAEAVLANAERWRVTSAGRELLPGLVDAFAPRFDVVRLILAEADRRLDERLADARLGIVSPRALPSPSGAGASLGRAFETGTGPFELRERTADRQLLHRDSSWWGAAEEPSLAPALEQVEFRAEGSSAVRFALLDAGEAQLADELPAAQARQAREDPLLTVVRGTGGTSLGLSRAVRGIESAREIPSLSSVWLTSLTVAE